MTVTQNPPTVYRHWKGRPAYVDGDDGWPYPEIRQDADGRWWVEVIHTDRWRHLGYGPTSKTQWGRFWTHIHHGRLMGYPWLSVVVFAVRGLAGRMPPR